VTPALIATLKEAHEHLLHGSAKLALHRCNVDADPFQKAKMHINDARMMLRAIIEEMERYGDD